MSNPDSSDSSRVLRDPVPGNASYTNRELPRNASMSRVAAASSAESPTPNGPDASTTSTALDTSCASPSRIIRWHPVDDAEVTGPGTAITGRPNFRAQLAVLRAPLRQPASTTTTPSDNAATSRFLARNRNFAGVVPGGYSLITAPELAICLSSRACPDGYARSTPQAKTASVFPPTPNAARCAAPSIPKAAPEITVHPSTARSPAISAVTCSPYAVDARVPTIPTDLSVRSTKSLDPNTHNTNGAVSPPEIESVKGKHSPRRPIGAVRCYESATHRLHQVEVSLGCVDVSAGSRLLLDRGWQIAVANRPRSFFDPELADQHGHICARALHDAGQICPSE